MIWPFNRKKKERESSWEESAIIRLRDWRPIGGKFEYLGRMCVVTGHYSVDHWPKLQPVHRPGIRADYADNNGVIHVIQFGWLESAAIMGAQP